MTLIWQMVTKFADKCKGCSHETPSTPIYLIYSHLLIFSRDLKHVDFDLICDVTGIPDVIQVSFLRQVLQNYQMPFGIRDQVAE